MLSKTNSFTRGKYTFQPTKYDENGNLYWALYRKGCHKPKCKVTGIYKFGEDKVELIYVAENWMNHKHRKLLDYMLNEYDWKL